MAITRQPVNGLTVTYENGGTISGETSGDKTLAITANENTGRYPRRSKIKIQGTGVSSSVSKTLTINQKAAPVQIIDGQSENNNTYNKTLDDISSNVVITGSTNVNHIKVSAQSISDSGVLSSSVPYSKIPGYFVGGFASQGSTDYAREFNGETAPTATIQSVKLGGETVSNAISDSGDDVTNDEGIYHHVDYEIQVSIPKHTAVLPCVYAIRIEGSGTVVDSNDNEVEDPEDATPVFVYIKVSAAGAFITIRTSSSSNDDISSIDLDATDTRKTVFIDSNISWTISSV